MAQKIECDKCSAQVEGSIIYEPYIEKEIVRHRAPRPSADKWYFLQLPYNSKGRSSSGPRLLCPACVDALHEFCGCPVEEPKKK